MQLPRYYAIRIKGEGKGDLINRTGKRRRGIFQTESRPAGQCFALSEQAVSFGFSPATSVAQILIVCLQADFLLSTSNFVVKGQITLSYLRSIISLTYFYILYSVSIAFVFPGF